MKSELVSSDQCNTDYECRESPIRGEHCWHSETERMRNGSIRQYDRCCWCAKKAAFRITHVPDHGPYGYGMTAKEYR